MALKPIGAETTRKVLIKWKALSPSARRSDTKADQRVGKSRAVLPPNSSSSEKPIHLYKAWSRSGVFFARFTPLLSIKAQFP
jgi:hypothetical protein